MSQPETALATRPALSINLPPLPSVTEIEAINQICKIAAYSGFVNSTSRELTQRAADAFFVAMYGRDLGIPPMVALKTIYVINGKPSCSGEALLSLMRRAGIEVEVPDPSTVTDSATVRVRRPGSEWKTYTFTLVMAEAAGLATKDMWKKYRPQMLIWRAVSLASKFECSDITGGLYTIEEVAPATAELDESGALISSVALVSRTAEPPADVRNGQFSEPDRDAGTTVPETGEGWAQNGEHWKKFVDWLTSRGLTPATAANLLAMQTYDAAAWSAKFADGKAACLAVDAAVKATPAQPKAAWVPEVVEIARRVYGLDGDAMLKILNKRSWADFADKAQAENTMHKTAVERQLPVICDRVMYTSYGKNGKALEFETPGIILRLPGGRSALVEKLGDDGKIFYDENGLMVWETGHQYDIDAVKLIWSKNKKGAVSIESVSMVVPYEAFDADTDEVIDLEAEFPRETVPA